MKVDRAERKKEGRRKETREREIKERTYRQIEESEKEDKKNVMMKYPMKREKKNLSFLKVTASLAFVPSIF